MTAPAPPIWRRQAWQERGATLTVAMDAPAKARHGRHERRILWALADPASGRSPTPPLGARRPRLWALADPAQNARIGDTGTVGRPWPHAQQVCRIERRRICQRTGETEAEVTHAVTSLPASRADAAALLALARGHWGIENEIRYVRDATFDEDRRQVRSGAAPQAFAACRNLAIALLRRRHATNIAAALRRCAWRPRLAVRLLLSGTLRR